MVRSPASQHAALHRVVGRDAAQRDADPGQQLFGTERLGDVVVGAEVERLHLVGLVAARREHDDRHLRGPPDAPADLGAFEIGQAEVEHDEIGRMIGGQPQRLGAGAGDVTS